MGAHFIRFPMLSYYVLSFPCFRSVLTAGNGYAFLSSLKSYVKLYVFSRFGGQFANSFLFNIVAYEFLIFPLISYQFLSYLVNGAYRAL